MAIYMKTLILVDSVEEAAALNADIDRSDIFHEAYAIHYGTMELGFRYEELDDRYTGDIRSLEWERYIASCKREDLRRGFDN